MCVEDSMEMLLISYLVSVSNNYKSVSRSSEIFRLLKFINIQRKTISCLYSHLISPFQYGILCQRTNYTNVDNTLLGRGSVWSE
jgi:hypothetical protein